MTPAPVVVIGAGIAGLSAAWRLYCAGIPVTVLERDARVGGVIRAARVGGFFFEEGPNTVPSTARHLMTLVEEVGLSNEVIHSREDSHHRLLWTDSGLIRAPSSPLRLLTTSLLSFAAKVRILREPWVAAGGREQETLGEFLERRFGRSAAEVLADPFVAGVFAGRLDHLGADAFPRLRRFEREHGSIMRGFKALAKERRAAGEPRVKGPRPLLTFADGLEMLPARIKATLGTRIRLRHVVHGIEPMASSGGGWQVHAAIGERHVTYDASHVILAAPAWVTSELVERHNPDAAACLRGIPYPHVASVSLGYPVNAVRHPLDAFGFLVGSNIPIPDHCRVLGALFLTSIFDGRAPEGHVSISVMMGGTRQPELAAASDRELVERARNVLGLVLGVRGMPSAVHVKRWAQAIPQYVPGHEAAINTTTTTLAAQGVFLAGNYTHGVGVDSAVESGFAVAEEVATRLNAARA